jgi:glycosyltransferase involved in cell wall biosynthesis
MLRLNKIKMSRKKILVLTDWFAPGYKAGGPIQSCVNFAWLLKEEFDIYVLTTDTDHGETVPYPRILPDVWLSDLYPGFKVKYLRKAGLRKKDLRREMLTLGADYVYLNHLFSPFFVVYPLWLKYTGRLKSEVVLCPRGALYDSALSVKRWKKTPFIRLFSWLGIPEKIIFHATNEREKTAIHRFFPRSTVRIADNLPRSDQPAFVSCPKEPGMMKCVFIARIVPIKNILFFLHALEMVKARVEFTIVGPVEDRAYWEECRQQIQCLGAHITVHIAGPRRNDELISILQAHHLFVLPTTGENFGHSIFEAFLSGRPVLISDQTPWLGLTLKRTGWDLPLHDAASFASVVEEVAAWDQATFNQWARAAWDYAHAFINNPGLRLQYTRLFV